MSSTPGSGQSGGSEVDVKTLEFICQENERYYPFKLWSKDLLPTDRWNWSSPDGQQHKVQFIKGY